MDRINLILIDDIVTESENEGEEAKARKILNAYWKSQSVKVK